MWPVDQPNHVSLLRKFLAAKREGTTAVKKPDPWPYPADTPHNVIRMCTGQMLAVNESNEVYANYEPPEAQQLPTEQPPPVTD